MTRSWEEIENLLTSWNNQKFYKFIKETAKNNQLTYIDSIEKLSLILIGLPCENRYEIFKLPKIQAILNNFNAKAIIKLYQFFPPEDAYQFLNSQPVISRLSTCPLSNHERKDIISYFRNDMKDSVTNLLNANSALPVSFINRAGL